jgi:hypothetical protein
MGNIGGRIFIFDKAAYMSEISIFTKSTTEKFQKYSSKMRQNPTP